MLRLVTRLPGTPLTLTLRQVSDNIGTRNAGRSDGPNLP